jgi:hypothetical protein
MPSDHPDLVARYQAEPDEVLLAALTTGETGYTPEAWAVITAEAKRRSLSTQPHSPVEPAVTELSEAIEPLPTWLSALLIGLAVIFLVVQVLLLLAYYQFIDSAHAYLGSTSTLAMGVTAWTATRFIRTGPHAPLARRLRWTAIALTAGAILLRLL